MSYPAIWLATATVGRHRCPQKRLQTARQPPVYPSSSPDHRACNSLTPFRCPHAVHPCPSVDSGLVLFDRGVLVFPAIGDERLAAEFDKAVLERKDLRRYMEFDGILEYGDGVEVSPSGNGVLTYIAPEGSELERGSVVFRFYKSISDLEILIAEQQIVSANAAVAQAELALEGHVPSSGVRVRHRVAVV